MGPGTPMATKPLSAVNSPLLSSNLELICCHLTRIGAEDNSDEGICISGSSDLIERNCCLCH